MQRDEVRVIGWAGVSDDVGSEIVLPTGMVAIQLTGVEGSTRARSAEPDAIDAAIERRNAVLEAAMSAHGGVAPPAQGEGDRLVAPTRPDAKRAPTWVMSSFPRSGWVQAWTTARARQSVGMIRA